VNIIISNQNNINYYGVKGAKAHTAGMAACRNRTGCLKKTGRRKAPAGLPANIKTEFL